MEFLIFFVSFFAIFGMVFGGICLMIHGEHPFTALGRAKMAYRRRKNARIAELITRGYEEFDVRYTAGLEIQKEAEETTRVLKREGIES